MSERGEGRKKLFFVRCCSWLSAAASTLSPLSPRSPTPRSLHYVCNAASEYELHRSGAGRRAGSTTPNAAAAAAAAIAAAEQGAVHRKPDNEPDSQTHTIAAGENEGASEARGGCNPH